MEHRPFLVLADQLTRNGFAVLRYDDRGTAQSTGQYAGATIEDFARDASAAVEFLNSHARIDGLRIGLAGHSEGGLVAPIVANDRDDIAFVVLMAGSGVNGRTVLLEQNEAMLRASNIPEPEIAVARAVSDAMMRAVVDAEPDADTARAIWEAVEEVIATIPEARRKTAATTIREQASGQVERLQSPWMRHFLSYDPAPALRELNCPVLIIIGSNDLQVVPEMNVPAMRTALAWNERATFVELKGLNHMFQSAETGLIVEYAEIDETINDAALDAITHWLENAL
jgi:pimeloyl-ACP methyl ester carboxylesterase